MTVYLLIYSIIPTCFLVVLLFDSFVRFFFFNWCFFFGLFSRYYFVYFIFFLSLFFLLISHNWFLTFGFLKSWGITIFLVLARISFVFLILLNCVTKLSYLFLRFSCSKYNIWYYFLHMSSNSFASSSFFFLFFLSLLTFAAKILKLLKIFLSSSTSSIL